LNRYSIWALARHALSGHANWQRAWRDCAPRRCYDAVIVGGGGHGLATAFYLAKEHGMRNIAVLERGLIGLGNSGRNTTIVRSNYLWDASAHLYEHSLRLWEDLARTLNFNVMFSPRGIVNLAHNERDLRELSRRFHANRLNGIDAELLTTAEVQRLVPILDCSPAARYPVLGASLQRRGGTARHDAVVWGYARAADALGVDVVQHCEVTAIRHQAGRVVGVETTRGSIDTPKIGVAVSGHAGVLARMVGLRLPIESHPLQALVSEPIKPVLDTVVMSNTVHVYVSQSDKGELVVGAGMDPYNSYSQRGGFATIEATVAALTALFPSFRRLKLMRHWAGVVDVCPDASPIVAKTPIAGLYFNCGWGTGGFKAIPGSGQVFAHTIAHDEPHRLNAAFSLERFTTGALVDEHGAAAVAH